MEWYIFTITLEIIMRTRNYFLKSTCLYNLQIKRSKNQHIIVDDKLICLYILTKRCAGYSLNLLYIYSRGICLWTISEWNNIKMWDSIQDQFLNLMIVIQSERQKSVTWMIFIKIIVSKTQLWLNLSIILETLRNHFKFYKKSELMFFIL